MCYRFLPGFIVRTAEGSTYDHWQGGLAAHDGAFCKRCKRPWLLLWDINCADPRFQIDGRPAFGNLERLPLYYCWSCVADLSYQVIDRGRLQVWKSAGKYQGDDFPYAGFPAHFDRQAIELSSVTEMPDDVRQLLTEEGDQPIPDPMKAKLAHWLDHDVKSEFDIWWQQFGGEPWLAQGEETVLCSNKQCRNSRGKIPMKVLAAICNHPPAGLPMIETVADVNAHGGAINRWVQVVFHICPECLTVHAFNRCG